MPPSTKALGRWSAVLATVCSVTYGVGQLAEWFGLLLVAIHQVAPPDRRVWSHGALAFGTIYAALISVTYFVQLAWVTPRLAAGRPRGIEPFLFVPFDSFLYAVDILGYSFMSAATLLAARVFTGAGVERVARRFLTANGLLLPFIALQMYAHWLIWIAALWAVTFPGSELGPGGVVPPAPCRVGPGHPAGSRITACPPGLIVTRAPGGTTRVDSRSSRIAGPRSVTPAPSRARS